MGTKKKKLAQKQPSKKVKRWLLGGVASLLLIILGVYLAFQLSPWPGALFIRYEFNKGGAKMAAEMAKHVPAGVSELENQQYKPHDKDGYLDVFYPEYISGTSTVLPTVVWVHGGAWVSGDKDTVDNYLKILASKGYTVVGVNYSIAPGKKYPTPILQVNDALKYLQQHAERLHIDPDKFVLAGDSAGSQIVAQVGTIITNPSYASEVNMSSPLAAEKLKGMVLNCGAYDLALPHYNGPDGEFLKTVLWAYSGTKDFLHDKNIQHASVVDYVNDKFPPTFITAGNVDPLEAQSKEFAAKLASLKVPTSTLFYPENYQPELNHEYQFNLDQADAQQALKQIVDFLQSYAK